MAKNTPKRTATPFEKMITAIVILVILAVLGLAVFATYGRISENIAEQKIADEAAAISRGEKAANVRYIASTVGMTPEDYVAQYGLEFTGDFTEESEVNDMLRRMTLENYIKYSDEGAEEPTDIDALLEQWKASELGITKDTLWSEVETTLPISTYMGGDETFAEFISQYESYGYDMSTVTADMSISEANDAIEEIVSNGPTLTVDTDGDAEDAADTAEGEEAPAE